LKKWTKERVLKKCYPTDRPLQIQLLINNEENDSQETKDNKSFAKKIDEYQCDLQQGKVAFLPKTQTTAMKLFQ